MIKITDEPRCPICESEMLKMYGCGWDYDRFVCSQSRCDGEHELNSMTYILEDGTLDIHIVENEE